MNILMEIFFKITAILALVQATSLSGAFAPIAQVDFNYEGVGSPTETDAPFVGYDGNDQPGGITVSGVTVVVSGSGVLFFDRGPISDSPPFTYGDLYRDHVYHNGGGTISFDLSGLTPNESYQLTWYLYDVFGGAGAGATVVNRIKARGGSNTTGSTIDAAYIIADPLTSNSQYAFTGTWSSTDSSLEIDVEFVSITVPIGNIVRVNGFELSAFVPEPPTYGMLGGLLALVLLRRGSSSARGTRISHRNP